MDPRIGHDTPIRPQAAVSARRHGDRGETRVTVSPRAFLNTLYLGRIGHRSCGRQRPSPHGLGTRYLAAALTPVCISAQASTPPIRSPGHDGPRNLGWPLVMTTALSRRWYDHSDNIFADDNGAARWRTGGRQTGGVALWPDGSVAALRDRPTTKITGGLPCR
jgi:hypothetical protein